ncbi:conserved hypothetical protein [Talaromyces stipitatus ATCC 10500]|uniref:Uncharacterized protein n=1 Tax=Talaromyces stipitatus (strain ATCC 10500 / CBS 375.48 / QM 6759 / NRRL 1006) TaxID=441959 RepID=B8LYN5_TALSN|nr:uncharacterized protein TSTA_068200 [Talaromyces stipitatus ATCC 10500]EED23393.1 conserved hypothetical protein [Talaromyces stipitatus ATCC 10500]
MFELPEAKRIRRDEIVSPSSSTRSSPDIIPAENEEAHARLGQLLAFDIFTTININQVQQPSNLKDNHTNQKDGDDEEEFDFRLFSAPNTATKIPGAKKEEEMKTQKLKIRLRSPTPVDAQPGEGRFIVPFRGWSYYVTKPEMMNLSARDEQEKIQIEEEDSMRRRQFEDVAVTGDDVVRWARSMETPGCHLPWRVVRLDRRFHRVPKSLLRGDNEMKTITTTEKKKSKPGKKRRIILRTRAAAVTAAAATSNMTEAEKRNKKNRERKIKRRQKERERKAALAATTTTATDVVGATADGDSSV